MEAARNGSLVTGATGFLGRRLCGRLKQEGERVVAVGRSREAGPWDQFAELDLAKDPIPEGALEGVATVYHLASRAHAVADSQQDAGQYRPVIVDGTARMLEAARNAGVRRFIFISSVKAMGEGNPARLPLLPLTENWPHTPQGPYGQAKAEAEQLVLASGIPHVVVLRPVMVYGPGEKGNLPRMMEAVRRGRFPPLPDNGNRRSMVHVDDLVEFVVRAAIYPIASGKVYIVAGNDALSTRELYDAIRKALGMKPVGWSVPLCLMKAAAAAGSVLGTLLDKRLPLDLQTLEKLNGSAWYSSELAQRELGYKPVHSVRNWLSGIDP